MRDNKVNVLKKMLGMLLVAPVMLSLSLFAADPVNYWKLDETAGPTYVDSIGGADGTCTLPDGCPTSTDGQIYGAQSFDGNDMIEVANTTAFDWKADANATIEFWMKSSSTVVDAGGDVMIGRYSPPGSVLWYVGVDVDGSIRAQINDGNSGNGVTSPNSTQINNGNWNHIAYVVTPDQVRVFVNGENDFNITRTATDLSSDTNVTIGDLNPGTNREYTGQLDDIKVYATDLNGSTIKEHYMDGFKPHLIEVTPVPTPTTDTTPDYTFSTDKDGTITYGGSCTSAATNAIVGNNPITFSELSIGTYNDCTITVTGTDGNVSNPLAVSAFEVTAEPDVTPPELAEVTAVTSPTDDNTPDYTFSSTEAGTITYGGSCDSNKTAAIAGDNTITFHALADGVYEDCTITVTDEANNSSDPLQVSDFVVDTTVPDDTAPILAEVTAIVSPTDDNTPDYTFSSDEAGTITYRGSCTSATTAAIAGDNTITFDTLADGTYSNCKIIVTDEANNSSLPLAVSEFVVDTTVPDVTAPTLAEVTAIVSPTDDSTPNYTFSSDEAGTITYRGSCTSATTAAIAGDNTITFDTLADGLYNDCTITVTDEANNSSLPLYVSEFVVDTTVPDTIVSDGGGGGCTYNPNSKNFDMMFLLMIALGLFYPVRRRFIK